MQAPAEVSGSKFKERPSQEDDYEAGAQLLRPISSDNQGGSTRTAIIRPAAELGGSKSHLKKSYSWKYSIIIPFTILLFAALLAAVFLVLFLNRPQEERRLADGLVETQIDCGTVQGFEEDGAYVFRGIPYALPPVGDLRWRKTVPLEKMEDCWQGKFYAHASGPHCYQKPFEEKLLFFDEDCLYLDVYTPDVEFRTPKSVVVYFNGDSFMGDNKYSIRLKPSAKLAREQQIVFVSVNYRLGPFGFLALNEFHNRETGSSGNYGLYDMIAALRWIQMNIDNFGGNPTTVTLLGYGSSATALLGLIVSPLAEGYFNQVWMTGGSADFYNATLEEKEIANKRFLKNIDCENFHCLQHKRPNEILESLPEEWKNQDFTGLPPEGENSSAIFVVDGDVVPDFPSNAIKEGHFNDASIVVGAPAYQLEALSRFQHTPWKDVLEYVDEHLGNFSESLMEDAKESYFLLEDEPNPLQVARLVSEIRVLCPLFQLARRAQHQFTNVVHSYTVSYLPSDKRFKGPAHLLDVAAIFNQLHLLLDDVTSEDEAFSRSMRDLFYHFVRYTRFGTEDRGQTNNRYTYLDVAGQRIIPSYKSHRPHCDLWLKSSLYPQYARQN